MDAITKSLKDAGPACGIILAAALFLGMVGPGKNTPAFLIPK